MLSQTQLTWKQLMSLMEVEWAGKTGNIASNTETSKSSDEVVNGDGVIAPPTVLDIVSDSDTENEVEVEVGDSDSKEVGDTNSLEEPINFNGGNSCL